MQFDLKSKPPWDAINAAWFLFFSVPFIKGWSSCLYFILTACGSNLNGKRRYAYYSWTSRREHGRMRSQPSLQVGMYVGWMDLEKCVSLILLLLPLSRDGSRSI